MRIGVIHISQETNDFNRQPTTLRDFESFGTGATRLREG
jgi:hypothetical protein